MKKIEKPLPKYKGYTASIYFDDNDQDEFKFQVMIDYYGKHRLFEPEEKYSTIKEAFEAGELLSKKEIDTHLRKKELFEKCLEEKLNTDSETKNIELGDWGTVDMEFALRFHYKGKWECIPIPDSDLDDIDNPSERGKIIEEAFHRIKQKLTKP